MGSFPRAPDVSADPKHGHNDAGRHAAGRDRIDARGLDQDIAMRPEAPRRQEDRGLSRRDRPVDPVSPGQGLGDDERRRTRRGVGQISPKE